MIVWNMILDDGKSSKILNPFGLFCFLYHVYMHVCIKIHLYGRWNLQCESMSQAIFYCNLHTCIVVYLNMLNIYYKFQCNPFLRYSLSECNLYCSLHPLSFSTLLFIQRLVDVKGMGSAKVHAIDKLDVNISGMGSVHYEGSPDVNKSISGMGTLKRR